MTSTTDTPMNRPLEDMTVVELGHIAAGPFCSLLLADLGADVVKIEHGASGGDSVRNGTPIGNSLFNAVNRNKRGITLNLKSDGGMEVFRDLIETADVFIENLRPGAPEKLGIGYETLHEVNPQLVYCSIKGFNDGPYQDFPALEPVAEALSGLMSITGHPDKPPARAGTSVADMTAALFGAFGITAALRQREHTGTGQHITAPLFESTVSLMGYWLVYAQAYDENPEPLGAGHDNWAPYDVYRSADNRWVFVGPSSQKQWERLCKALGLDLHTEDRFATLEDRRRNETALNEELQSVIADLTADELVAGLREVDVPVAPVQDLSDVSSDKHLAVTETLSEIDTVEGETASVSVPKIPIRSSQFDRPDPTDPPELGADTDAILRDLDYSAAEIESFRENDCL